MQREQVMQQLVVDQSPEGEGRITPSAMGGETEHRALVSTKEGRSFNKKVTVLEE